MANLRHILIIILLISSSFLGFAGAEDKASVFNVFVYMERLTFEADEPVMLQMNIKNNTGTIKSFKIFDTDYTNFRPVIYDMMGREEDTLVDYRLKNKSIDETIKGIKPRIIELAGNEAFSYAIDLRKIYNIQSGKDYRVKAFFSPDAVDTVSILSNNQLNFRISRSTGNFPNTGIARYKQFSSPSRGLSAAEVVELFLKAEMDRNWENYLKYIDIEKYINAYPDYVRIYNEAIKKNDVELKERIILEFVNFLKSERSDYIMNYHVQNELRAARDNIYVEAMVTRFSAKLPLKYRYRYLLERFENLWLITDVEVTVSKGRNI